MIVRELIALLGIQMDGQSFQKADRGIDGLKRAATVLGTLFVTGVVAQGMRRFVRMASDVQETTNVVNETFEGSAQGVVDWAARTGAAVNRSRFTMQKFAADIGAVTKPALGSAEATAEMSTALAALAVDLGSFFNISDEDATTRIISGLMGETEAVRRVGIDLSAEALEKLAASQGKSFKSMSQGEKIALRYKKIMLDTADAQGDATRTADGYANASKGMGEALKDLQITIGNRLLPSATRLVIWVRDGTQAFLKMAEGTKIIETALNVLGVVATVVAVKMLLPFLPVLAIAAAVAVGIGVIIVAVEDLIAFFEGRESLTGHALEAMREGLDLVASKASEVAGQVWSFFAGMWQRVSDTATSAADFIGQTFRDSLLGDVFTAALATSEILIKGIWDALVGMAETAATVFAPIVDAARWLIDQLPSLETIASEVGAAIKRMLPVELLNAIGAGAKLVGAGAGKAASFVHDTIGTKGIANAAVRGAASAFLPGGLLLSAPSIMRPNRAGPNVQQTNTTTVNVQAGPGMDEEKLAAAVDEKMRAANERQNRELQAQLLPSYAR
jgi:hypothetical protein